jgi:2-polyprenyl-6-methoxyphenol hydroxylase-like FAD-dependent oxidoreductase
MTGEDAAAFEAVVVGGGPAGAAASRLLSLWGHRVLVLTRRPPQDRPLPVSIPPSSRKLLDVLGVTEAVEDAGFQRSRGNTVWWGEAPTRCVDFPDGSSGFQVLLAELEGLLLEGSAEAGAEVRRDATVRSVDTGSGPARVTFESPDGSPGTAEATLVLDCSGRAGVVAAGFRIHDHANATVALCGLWRRPGGWGLTDETHTLVESYRDGWAWSIPTAPGVRFVTVMVDPRRTALSRGQERDRTYLAELDKTVRMRDLVQAARFDGDTWGHTASQYCAERYQGKSHLLVGDAASFIDPLSSFGVKKALASAWLAAVVANTAARTPSMAEAARELFDRRERYVWDAYRSLAARFYRDAARAHGTPFWSARAEALPASADAATPPSDVPSLDAPDPLDAGGEPDVDVLRQDPAVLAAFDVLRRTPEIRLRLGRGVRRVTGAAVRGRLVVPEDRLATDTLPGGLRYLRGVDLLQVVEQAPAHHQVPDLWEAYCRSAGPVILPDFLGVLSVLLARGILVNG